MHPTEDVRRTRVGDRVVVRGHHVGEPARYGEVLEVVGESGGAPYLVRWELDGHVSRFYPSSDAHIGTSARRSHRAARARPASEGHPCAGRCETCV